MKKIIFLILLGLTSFLKGNAQKENGVVYSEHEAINKTKAMWTAFVAGDKESFYKFFTDTITYVMNGASSKKLIKDFGANIDFWQGFKDLSFKDDAPAYPDAIQYKKEGLWVQDWIRATGIHKETGVNIDLPFNDLFHFNKEGKINTLIQYADPTCLDEIGKSKQTIENGKVYINHPYIVAVRKCVNAYCAKDIETFRTFYSQDAKFWKSDSKIGKFVTLEEEIQQTKQTFDAYSSISLKQFGYPDCIYYLKDNNYVVYSWWILSYTTTDGRKNSDIPVMMSDSFDKEGKINAQFLYLSGVHFK